MKILYLKRCGDKQRKLFIQVYSIVNPMIKLIRKLVYCDELNKILEEEKSLVRKWSKKFPYLHSRNKTLDNTIKKLETGKGGLYDPHIHYQRVENAQNSLSEVLSFKDFWKKVCHLNTEVRKIEEIKKLIKCEEEKLPKKMRKSLIQLKKKLKWQPIKLMKKEEAYINDYEGVDKKKYKNLIKELTYDETCFWKNLIILCTRMAEKLDKVIDDYDKAVNLWKQLSSEIKSKSPNWYRHLLIAKRLPLEGEERMKHNNEQLGEFYLNMFKEELEIDDKILESLTGYKKILNDIKKRLENARPEKV